MKSKIVKKRGKKRVGKTVKQLTALADKSQFGAVLEDINEKFEYLVEGFGVLSDRQERLEKRQEKLEHRFEEMDIKFESRFNEVDRRFEEMDAKFEKRFQEMDAKFEKRFQEMDAKFEKRFDEVDKRFQEMDAKFEKRFQGIEANLRAVLEYAENIEEELQSIRRELSEMKKTFVDREYVALLETRVERVEKELFLLKKQVAV